MAKQTDFGKYAYFVYLGNNRIYGFSTYSDSDTGQCVGYVTGFDKGGNPQYKEWIFDNDSRRQVRVSTTEVDKTGRKAIDFLRNSPECMDSPNGKYVGDGESRKQVLIYFKEINDEKTAETALSSKMLVIEAQQKASQLSDTDLQEVAHTIGVFKDIEKEKSQILVSVLDYASNRPKLFLDLVNDTTRGIKSLVSTALHKNVLSQDGRAIKWETKLIGADFDDAVSNLIKDDKLKKAIEFNLSKIK